METTTIADSNTSVRETKGRKEKHLQNQAGMNTASFIVRGLERTWVNVMISVTIFTLALKCYRSFRKAMKAIRDLQSFKNTVYGKDKKWRYLKVDGKYQFGIFFPAFRSNLFNRFIQTEFYHTSGLHTQPVNRMQSVYLAITNTCPLKCEHCFEWNNLNRGETFTTDELKELISSFQEEGCTQFHFTGGEPLVKMERLEELIRHASPLSECWVLTSGLNLTPEHAIRLKKAGARGVFISLDHHDRERHNMFRGSEHAFDWAMQAAQNANQAKLVTAFTICMTRDFITEKNLMEYAELAKNCGVSFVQVLEPKALGHYEGKDVTLSKEHTNLLGEIYLKINFDPQFRDYPVFVYHGYYHRKMGCYSGGNRSLYVDSAGYINACPFCHSKNYDARDLITEKLTVDKIQIGGCSVYPI